MNRETVQHIIMMEDLAMRKISAKMVREFLAKKSIKK
jgi:hypothetical protein